MVQATFSPAQVCALKVGRHGISSPLSCDKPDEWHQVPFTVQIMTPPRFKKQEHIRNMSNNFQIVVDHFLYCNSMSVMVHGVTTITLLQELNSPIQPCIRGSHEYVSLLQRIRHPLVHLTSSITRPIDDMR